jgi:hypothetical protein
LRYFIDELRDEVMSVYNLINACCLTKQSRNLAGTIKSIIENVIMVPFFFCNISIRKTTVLLSNFECASTKIFSLWLQLAKPIPSGLYRSYWKKAIKF